MAHGKRTRTRARAKSREPDGLEGPQGDLILAFFGGAGQIVSNCPNLCFVSFWAMTKKTSLFRQLPIPTPGGMIDPQKAKRIRAAPIATSRDPGYLWCLAEIL